MMPAGCPPGGGQFEGRTPGLMDSIQSKNIVTRHFYDQDHIVGKEIAKSIGWDGHVAWDIYLFYAPYADWNNGPPAPTGWMHQLTDSWADREHYRTGDGLVKGLLNEVANIFSIANI